MSEPAAILPYAQSDTPKPASKARITWVDAAKGVSIIFVVVYHLFLGLDKRVTGVPAFWDDVLNPVLTLVRMPLFFFVSGMFIARSVKKETWKFVADKLAVVVYPYLLWQTIQFAIAKASGAKEIVGVSGDPTWSKLPMLLVGYPKPYGQFWFLYVLFMSMMAYLVMSKLRFPTWLIAIVGVLFFYEGHRLFETLDAAGAAAAYDTRTYLAVGALVAIVGPSAVIATYGRTARPALALFAGCVAVGALFIVSGHFALRTIQFTEWGPAYQFRTYFIYMALGAIAAPFILPNAHRLWSVVLGLIAIACGAAVSYCVLHEGLKREGNWGPFIALAGVASLLAIVVLMDRFKLAGPFRWIGKHSLPIFVAHVVAAAVIRTVLLKAGVTTFWPHLTAGLLIGIGGPMVLAFVVDYFRIPFVFTAKWPKKKDAAAE